MKVINVIFTVRFSGDSEPTSFREQVCIENDSTEKETDEQIKWYYNKFVLTDRITELKSYKIVEN